MKVTANRTPLEGASPLTPLADAAPHDAEDASVAQAPPPPQSGARARTTGGRSAADAPPGSNIDQLRDIIFGGQMRDYEKRFVRMEERLAKEVGELREEVRQRCATLERYVRDEFESFTGQLRSEQQARAGEERRLAQSISDGAKAVEERIAATTEVASKQHRELRAQLLEQTQTLTDETQRRHAELLSLIDQEAAQLRDEKADRSALSALFLELALRLRGESIVPREE